MTWLKLCDRFADDCARAKLSDAAFRTHVSALVWTMRRETDGVLDQVDIRRAVDTLRVGEAIVELLTAGFWQTLEGDRYRIVHGMNYQRTAKQIARDRALALERQTKRRQAAEKRKEARREKVA